MVNRSLIVVLLAAAFSSGCTATWSSWFDSRGVATPKVAGHEPLPPGPITADLVEPGNAHRLADAAWDEMAREEQKDQTPAAKDSKKR
jgi:hypothetical protein